MLILALLMPAVGIVLAAPLAPELNRALAAISLYTDDSGDLADELVKRLGFVPAIADDEWTRLPTIHKLEMAYRASEAAEPKKGGQYFLALMSRELAQMYDAVEREPALRVHFEASKDLLGTRVRFSSPEPRTRPVPSEIRKAIIALAEYTAAGAESAFQLFTNPATFNMPAEDAYELLATSGSHAEALTHALGRHSPEQQTKILRSLTLEVRSRFDGAKYEKALDPFDTKKAPVTHGEMPPDVPGPGGPGRVEPDGGGGAGGGGAGGGGASKGSATSGNDRQPPPRPTPPTGSRPSQAQRYQRFIDLNHPVGQRSFSLMSKGSKGFGGVVFGDSVTSSLPPIRSVSQRGDMLDFKTADGSTLSYGPVSADLVQAAHRIVYTGFGGLAPLGSDEGVGLVSVGTSSLPPRYHCDPVTLTFAVTARAEIEVTLHPALVDTELGWAALMVDITPLAPEVLIDGSVYPSAAKRAVNLFRSNQHSVTWKVLDTPVELFRDAERVALRRIPKGGERLTEGALRTNFLKMVPFGWGDYRDTRFSVRFDRAFSDLARVSYDFYTMNQFAATLALVRQAHSDGATFAPPRAAPERRTPEVLWFDETGVHAQRIDGALALSAEVARLERCFEAVEAVNTEPARRFREKLAWALLWTHAYR
jgi:hypothetical protein